MTKRIYNKRRFLSNYKTGKYNQDVYLIYDMEGDESHFVQKNCNNVVDDLGCKLDNLMQRNNYLRAEASRLCHLKMDVLDRVNSEISYCEFHDRQGGIMTNDYILGLLYDLKEELEE